MSADDNDDDERTVIRPPGPPRQPAPGNDKTMQVGAPPPLPEDHGNGLPIGTFLAEFELTKLIGEGGFGIVYSATDHSLRRRVALKEYMPTALAARTGVSQVQVKSQRHRETFELGLKSFVNEARLLASFDHASLLKVYRFWEANGTAYMVMPFIEGVTLKDTLRQMKGPPDEEWLRTLLAPLTEALMVIHAEQCYHRDIAPDNIMLLAGSHRPLLLDFGAARRVIGDMTQALTVILKPGYAPVEQYAEIPGMKQGAWTDVYALAAVVYYAILGKTPPPSVGRLLNDTFVPLSQAAAGRYSEPFLAAIDRALAVRPEERTQSIEELRAQLGLSGAPASGITQMLAPAPAGVSAPAPRPAAAPAAAAAATRPDAASAAMPTGKKSGGTAAVAVGGAALLALAVGGFVFFAPGPAPAPGGTAAPSSSPTTVPAPGTVAGSPPADAQAAAPVVAPAVAPATAPSVTTAFDLGTEFSRVVQAQTPGFGVAATADKATLKIGHDEIGFTVTSERDGHLYIFARASDGTLAQVVPNTNSGAVRIKKGQRFHFPRGDGAALDASDPPGPVELLAVVSTLQRDFSELEPSRREGAFKILPSGADAAAVVARHKGPQPFMVGRAICPASGDCDSGFGAAVLIIDTVR